MPESKRRVPLTRSHSTNSLIKNRLTSKLNSRRDYLDGVSVSPPIVSPNFTQYDLSLSSESDGLIEDTQYLYVDPWWVTIRDKAREFTKQPIVEPLPPPSNVTSDETGNNIVRSKHRTRLRNLEVRKAKPNLPNKQKADDRFKIANSADDLTSFKARDIAMERNKQIQRMLTNFTPKDDTKVMIGGGDVRIVNVNGNATKHDQNLSLSYKKIVETLQLNFGKNEMDALGKLSLNDIIKYQGAIEAPTTAKITEVSIKSVEWTTRVHRQGPLDDVHETPPPSNEETHIHETPPPSIEETPPPFLGEDPEMTTRNRPPWVPETYTTERTSSLVDELQLNMKRYHLGYFSVFTAQTARSVARMKDDAVHKLTTALAQESVRMYNEESYILSFGNRFMKAFEKMLIRISAWPSDFVKHHASVLHHTIHSRYEYLAEDLNKIFDFIDDLFEDDEGIDLFRINELIDKYPNTTESAPEVLKATTRAVFAPFRRLSGSYTRQILIDSINKYIEKNQGLSATGAELMTLNKTMIIERRFSNKTRFAVVDRDNVTRKEEGKKATVKGCFGKYCIINEKVKDKDVKNKRNISDNYVVPMYKQQSVAPLRLTQKHLTTRQKYRTKNDFKQKHPNIYKKYINLKQKVHEKQKKKEMMKQFKSKYYSKRNRINKLKGYEKYSKIKAGKLKYKLLHNISESDFNDLYYSDDNEYDPDYYTYTDGTRNKAPSLTFEDKRSFSGLWNNSIKELLKKTLFNLNRNKNFSEKTPRRITSRTGVKNIGLELKTDFKSSKKYTDKISNNANVRNKCITKKYKTNIYHRNDDEANRKLKTNKTYEISRKHTKAPFNFRSVTSKNKVIDVSSYTDDEDILKFQISDAMRHDNTFVRPLRRSYHIQNRVKKGINQYSSYSNEEVILKSKIYKSFGFGNFSNPIIRRSNINNDDEVEVKKIRSQTFKPVNEMSSYSDEENVLREKLKVS